MIWLLLLLLLAVLGSTAVVVAALARQRTWQQEAAAQAMRDTETRLQALRDEWGRTLGQLTQMQTTALQTAQRDMGAAVRDMHVQLKSVEAQGQRILEASQNIGSLQDLLRPPKLRGGIGEILLHHLLEQVLPNGFFTLQHAFKDGRRVDAVIHVGERLVCIDAKFPLEQFRLLTQTQADDAQRRARREFSADVKKHINDIADKYILPEEGTYDFALMYIPAENVYYEIIVKDESLGERTGLFEHALQRKVIPVSPNNFYAYLQVILMGLKGLSVEHSAQQVLQRLAGLRTDLDRLQTDLVKTSGHLRDAQGSCESSAKRLGAIQDGVRRMELPTLTAEPAARTAGELETVP